MLALKSLLLCVAGLFASPAVAATVIDLGLLSTASGAVAYPEASSYDESDLQTARFLFAVGSPGTLSIALGYTQEERSPLIEVCTDPNDPGTCEVQPNGNYQDYAGVDLRSFTLGLEGQAGSTIALPEGFTDLVIGGPGMGKPSFGFDSIVYSFDIGRDFTIGAGGSYFADLAGFGLIRGPDFPGEGGGQVNYSFSFAPAAVPEPATWLMLIAGFGIVGAAIRRSRTRLSPALS